MDFMEQVSKYENFDDVQEQVQMLEKQLNRCANYADIAKYNINLAFAINRYHGGILNVRDKIKNPKKYNDIKQQIGVEAAKITKETKRRELEQIVSKEN